MINLPLWAQQPLPPSRPLLCLHARCCCCYNSMAATGDTRQVLARGETSSIDTSDASIVVVGNLATPRSSFGNGTCIFELPRVGACGLQRPASSSPACARGGGWGWARPQRRRGSCSSHSRPCPWRRRPPSSSANALPGHGLLPMTSCGPWLLA
jgi:hypothetical protein